MKTRIISFISIIFLTYSSVVAQYSIEPAKGFSPHIGTLVSMMDDLKSRISYQIKNMDQNATDFLLDEDANRIGAMILHLAATEYHYQLSTFESKQMDPEKDREMLLALGLGDKAREEFQGKPMSYYMDKWDEVRARTKELLKTKDDKWLMKSRGGSYNYYWAWFHVMEHQANHIGQIAITKKRIN